MKYPLPPLNPLKAFEAAARLSSLTHAADELNVSQVAVSRQVRVLEDYLGIALFRRLHRSIELTREGKELYEGISTAFQDISNAAGRVSRRAHRNLLSIQSYTTFSQRWLIPRLANFHETNQNIEVRLSSSTAPVDFEAQNIDAAILSGHGDWPHLHSEKLVDIELIPICSPGLLAARKLQSVNDLAKVPLLYSTARPNDWTSWLSAAGAHFKQTPGIRVDNSALAYEAASMNLGMAIAVKIFVERQILNGSFIAPFETTCKTGEAYYLTWPKNIPPSEPLLKFLAWMHSSLEAPASSTEVG
ncbi:LysR substrate-binding domain-containing protein [Pseudomonas sp. M30-35]|uniref:LysR substrate-binding domain-containing protein n=1 Tax=Pseudomonas sp. M30-35 TaxID=1981174 RepID=UPI000B3C4201|nr:LysR substrate-binding domain-containing protein [Pseudomonas sp. M30-35]ARU88906.1 LysR family transcriptional regulator [Pseudomonas sp. M30-35]